MQTGQNNIDSEIIRTRRDPGDHLRFLPCFSLSARFVYLAAGYPDELQYAG